MNTTNRAVFVLMGFAVLALAMGPATALAQEPQQPPAPAPQAEQPRQPAPIEGDLVRVDAEAKKIVVKTADAGDVEFVYDENTEVTGAKDGAAGLVTMKEGRVTVHFTEDGGTKTATKIVIDPAQ